MGRKRIHPLKASLDERIDFSDPIWQNPEVDTGVTSFQYRQRKPNAIVQTGVIYKLLCTVNGRAYIGRTATRKIFNTPIDLDRIRCHTTELRRGSHKNTLMQSDWVRHGSHSFEWTIEHICRITDFESEIEFYSYLEAKELQMMFLHNSAYNSEVVRARLERLSKTMGYSGFTELMMAIATGEVSLTDKFGARHQSSSKPIQKEALSFSWFKEKGFEKHSLNW